MIRVGLHLKYPAIDAGVRALLAADPEIAILTDNLEAADVRIVAASSLPPLGVLRPGEAGSESVLILGAEGMDLQGMWRLSTPWGVLPIDVSSEELCAAVRALAAGLVVGTPRLMMNSREIRNQQSPLTEREVQILGMLSSGLANKQVAVELGISEHTVKFHVASIYTKLNVGNRTEAVREGLRNGWIAL